MHYALLVRKARKRAGVELPPERVLTGPKRPAKMVATKRTERQHL